MKERRKKVLKIWGAVFGVGALYYIWISITKIKVPCVIKLISGYDCPGCGTTRMMEALLRFDFKSAFYFNPFMMCALPFGFLLAVWWAVRYVKTGKREFNVPMWIITALLVISMIIFGILRNI